MRFVLKLTVLFGLEVTCADCYAVGSVVCVNLLREFYGKDAAKKGIIIGILLTIFAAFLCYLHLNFSPSPNDQMASVYASLLIPVLDVIMSSLFVFILVQILDYHVYGYLKNNYNSYGIGIRMCLSLLLSQAVDTFLFTYFALGLWIVDFWSVFFWSYLIKVIAILFISPCCMWCYKACGKNWVEYVQV